MSIKLTESQTRDLREMRDSLALTIEVFGQFGCTGIPCSRCPNVLSIQNDHICGTTVLKGFLRQIDDALKEEKPVERVTIRGVTYELKEIKMVIEDD